ncbi:MAG: hypothetical protein BM558_08525 [Roseobacter sp. MedPE-SW]|nr:MAG: hypothetical protein BM558_08525 [Roseobacter sp. MedPE-SW]
MKSLDDVDPNILIGYESGQYWQNRMDLMYYSYLDYIVRSLGKNAKSMIDIGTANCPYLEWFDWIPERVSFDMAEPYRSSTVEGIQGDFLSHDFGGKKYDVATCLQVLEHVPDVIPFARKLLEISDMVIVTVPYEWPATAADDHIHDPIGNRKLLRWMGRKPNYRQVIKEPFRGAVGRRLIAVYEADMTARYGRKDFKTRIRRSRFPTGEQG